MSDRVHDRILTRRLLRRTFFKTAQAVTTPWRLALAFFVAMAGPSWAADPDALWKIVHERCVPEQQQHADPKPCSLVDLSNGADRGYSVLRDLNGVAQFLLIPTARLTGIDDPALLAPGMPNFFSMAWIARSFVEGALQRVMPDDAFGLVINSVQGRTQEQLHIHIDCLRADVRDALSIHQAAISRKWMQFPAPLVGRTYMAIRIPGGQLPTNDPFKLLATRLPAQVEMGQHTLILTATITDGHTDFILLDRQVAREIGDRGNGTELLDRACTSAR